MKACRPKNLSINISFPKRVATSNGKTMHSGIFKNAISGRIYLDTLGLKGDGVADTNKHGGPDKAICAYCVDHFPFWEKEINQKLNPGAFGENFSIAGLKETEINVGDQFTIGDAIIECSQPRQPCHKLNTKFMNKKMVFHVQDFGFSGYYFRVIEPGWIEPNMEMGLLKESTYKLSIASAKQLMHQDKLNYKKMKKVMECTVLSESWKKTFRTRIETKATEDTIPRIFG